MRCTSAELNNETNKKTYKNLMEKERIILKPSENMAEFIGRILAFRF